jgi:hypothetical protein
MDSILQTLGNMIPLLSAYPWWVKLTAGIMIAMATAFLLELLFVPKEIPVVRWLPPSDDATIKEFVPAEMYQEWETKKKDEDAAADQLARLAAQQLGVGENPPSPSADRTSLQLKRQRAGNERNAVEVRIALMAVARHRGTEFSNPFPSSGESGERANKQTARRP